MEYSHPANAWFSWAKKSIYASRFAVLALVSLAIITAILTYYSSPDYNLIWQLPERVTSSRGGQVTAIFSEYGTPPGTFKGATLEVLVPYTSDSLQDVYKGDYTQVGAGIAGVDGIVSADLLPFDPAWTKNGGTKLPLVLHTQHGDEDRWSVTQVAVDQAPVLAVTLDRPLYMPGQSVKMRFLAADKDTGQPSAGQDLHIEVRDAKNNLIMSQHLKTSHAGVAHTELQLAKPCVQGSYTLLARVGKNAQRRQFSVRPFRLPRYKVRVEPNTTSIAAGDVITGRVKARYTYGDPVKGATVTLNITTYEGMRPIADTVRGVTDRSGSFAFSWTVPAQTGLGSSIELDATVASAAGRAERGTGSVQIAGGHRLSLYPANQAKFRGGVSTVGYLVLSEATGTGVKDAAIKLTLAELGGERDVVIRTDARGRAKFTWTPNASNPYMTANVTLPNGETFSRNLNVTLGNKDTINADAPTFQAGQTVDFQVSPLATGSVLMVVNRGIQIHNVHIPSGATRVSVELPSGSVGLSRLVRMGPRSSTHRNIWVSQRGTDQVLLAAQKPNYRPGQQASLRLQFPALEQKVTFGAVGVDEALYALKERADVPLPVLMRGLPPSLAQTFSQPMPDDEAGRAIYSSKLQRVLAKSVHPEQRSVNDRSRKMHNLEQEPLRKAWAVLLYLLLFVGVFWNVRITWRSVSKSAFSWLRTFALGGAAFVSGSYAIVLGTVHGEVLAGGAIVWCTVVMAWILGASIRSESIPLDRWVGTNLGVLAVALLLYTTIEPLRRSALAEYFPILAAGIPLLAFGAEAIIWTYIAYREREWVAAFGLASLASLLLAGTLVMTLSTTTLGKTDMGVIAPAPMPMMERAPEPRPKKAASQRLAQLVQDGAAPAKKAARIRSWFPETMLWLPEVAADSAGVATIDFEVPDSITTWRINAWANTSDGRFGEGQLGLSVTQPVFLELDLPTNLTAGDAIDVPVTLVNNSETTIMVPLAATGNAIVSTGSLPAGVTLTAGNRQVFWLRVRANKHGLGEVTVVAGDAETGDAVKRTVEIAANGRDRHDTYSGMINDGWVQPVSVPSSAIAQTMRVDVEIYPSSIADALEGMDAMLRSPQGCFEQISSANYPNVMVLQSMEDIPPEKWPQGGYESSEDAWESTHKNAQNLVALGYQKMLTFQKSDGGFALYPRDAYKSTELLTAYGLMQLAEMRKVSLVDHQVLERAASYLVNKQNDDGSWPVFANRVAGGHTNTQDIGQIRATAFITLGLLAANDRRYKDAIDRALSRIETRIDHAGSGDALALAANALAAGGRKEAARMAVSRLESSMKHEGDTGYWSSGNGTWMGGYGTYANVETTAMAAFAMLASESGSNSLPLALNYLAESRSSRGGWGTTQATVWALRTLNALRQKQKPTTLNINLDGSPMARANGGQGAGVLKLGDTPTPLVRFSTPTTGKSVVTIASTAETAAMAKAVATYVVPWRSREAMDPKSTPIEVRVKTPPNLAVTQPTETVLKLRNLTEDRLQTLIIEIPIAPGAYVAPDQLENWVTGGLIDEFEILPTHVRLYVDQLGPKKHLVFSLKWTPFVSGTMSLPPARAYRFYTPEPIAQAYGGAIHITPR